MTLIVSLIAPAFAILAGDTRVRYYVRGQLVRVRDGCSKVLPLEGGWVAGGSHGYLAEWFRENLLDGRPIDSLERFTDRLNETAPVRDRFAEVLVVQVDPLQSFVSYGVNLTQQAVVTFRSPSLDALLPPAVDAASQRALEDSCREWWQQSIESPPRSLSDGIRLMAGVFASARAICGPAGAISDDVEMGILRRHAGLLEQLHLPPTPAAVLAGTADHEPLLLPARVTTTRLELLTLVGFNVRLTSAGAGWRGDKLVVSWTGTVGVGSVKIATSTSAYPVVGAGTVYAGQTGVQEIATAFTSLQTVFVTITPYSDAAGTQHAGVATQFMVKPAIPGRGVPFDDGGFALKASDAAGRELADDVFIAAAKRFKFGTVASPATITKTVRIGAGKLVPQDPSQSYVTGNSYCQPGTANTTCDMKGAANEVPKGATILKVRARMYRENTGTDNAQCAVVKVLDDGTNSAVATVSHGASSGWRTDEVTLGSPQVVGDEAYGIAVQMRGVAAAVDARFLWCEIEYSIPDLAVGL